MLKRRSFLTQLSAGSVLAFLPFSRQEKIKTNIDKRDMTIDSVEVLKISGPYTSMVGVNKAYQSQSLYFYPDQKPAPYKNDPNPQEGTRTLTQHYMRIRTKGGLEGIYGYIDGEAVHAVVNQMKEWLLGKDAMNIEMIWDQLYRRNRHSRSGHYMMALSAVDNCLWDLRGKYFDAPVYELLGGSTKGDEVQVYGSCLGFSTEAGMAGPQAKKLYDQGFKHQKWFTADGPGDGNAGLQRSINLVKEIRESVGPDMQLMFDAYKGWDIPFATTWAREVEQYNPYWIEEAFPPNRIDSFIELGNSTTIQIATGEHFYNRWEVSDFLNRKAITIVQADPEWCGGVSELVKICHIASAHGAKVLPHGHNIPASMHVVASQSPEVCPLVEYLINHVPYKVHFVKNPPLTSNGKIKLPTDPGFGIELNMDKIEELVSL